MSILLACTIALKLTACCKTRATWWFYVGVLLLQKTGKYICRRRTLITMLKQRSPMQTTKEKVADKAVSKLTCLKPKNFVSENTEKCSLCLCHDAATHEQFQISSYNIWKSEQICSTHTQLVWHHADESMPWKTCCQKAFCLLSRYGQHSWEELKRSVAPMECSWFYRCLLGKSDSSPKVPLYMLHMHDMINLPYYGNTRLALFVLHSLYLHLSDWKIPSWILWHNVVMSHNYYMNVLSLFLQLVSFLS